MTGLFQELVVVCDVVAVSVFHKGQERVLEVI